MLATIALAVFLANAVTLSYGQSDFSSLGLYNLDYLRGHGVGQSSQLAMGLIMEAMLSGNYSTLVKSGDAKDLLRDVGGIDGLKELTGLMQIFPLLKKIGDNNGALLASDFGLEGVTLLEMQEGKILSKDQLTSLFAKTGLDKVDNVALTKSIIALLSKDSFIKWVGNNLPRRNWLDFEMYDWETDDLWKQAVPMMKKCKNEAFANVAVTQEEAYCCGSQRSANCYDEGLENMRTSHLYVKHIRSLQFMQKLNEKSCKNYPDCITSYMVWYVIRGIVVFALVGIIACVVMSKRRNQGVSFFPLTANPL